MSTNKEPATDADRTAMIVDPAKRTPGTTELDDASFSGPTAHGRATSESVAKHLDTEMHPGSPERRHSSAHCQPRSAANPSPRSVTVEDANTSTVGSQAVGQRVASLSLDLDNKWSYLKTHGDPCWDTYPSYLDLVVPHFLQIFQTIDVQITVFIVGQDAALAKNADALQSIAQAGHEIGNHSFNHEPWLQQYSADQIEREFSNAEQAIFEATGVVPRGFRGPGFSFSPLVLETLVRRGYSYDASTFPTFLGPVARAYYFLSTRLDDEERQERKNLFGGFSDGFRPLKPYYWRASDAKAGELVEIPVTTIPGVRTPFHLSYLLYLASFSEALAWAYWRYALLSCRIARTEPSLLLHPLDFVGGDEVSDLSFFPAMSMPGERKRAFSERVLTSYCKQYQVKTMAQHADIIRSRHRTPSRIIPDHPSEIQRSTG